jgi:hypothetical protein
MILRAFEWVVFTFLKPACNATGLLCYMVLLAWPANTALRAIIEIWRGL